MYVWMYVSGVGVVSFGSGTNLFVYRERGSSRPAFLFGLHSPVWHTCSRKQFGKQEII